MVEVRAKNILALLAALGFSTAAEAGGFARGTADTDILYEAGTFAARAGATVVVPNRKFDTNSNPALIGVNPFQSYVVPSAAVKYQLVPNFSCAGTYTHGFGAAGDWRGGGGTVTGKLTEEFLVHEFGLTCGANIELGNGKLWLLGGAFVDHFDYERTGVVRGALLPALNGLPTLLELDGTDVGYRIGVAYEMPEIALRTQLMYRSGTSFGATGNLTAPMAALGLGLSGSPATVGTIGVGRLPQSVEFKAQTGIAPGWLGFGSIKWTDWSAVETLDVFGPTGAIVSRNEYYWRDGWTVAGGIGHAFTDRISGSLSVQWDRGVSTGYDLMGDTYTVAAGGSFKDDWGGEFRMGLGLSYLSSSQETAYPTAYYPAGNASVDSGWAVSFGGSYKLTW